MELKEIHELVENYQRSLAAEYNAGQKAIAAKEVLERIKVQVLAEAQEAGMIDGKNADARKRQTAAIVSENALIDAACVAVVKTEGDAATATVTRKSHDALIGLTKAWLYSQSGIN